MTRGPRPRAIEVSEASGRFRKDPQAKPTNIIKGLAKNPEAPDFVVSDPTAKAVWDETVSLLEDCGILSATDTHLLTQYVITYSEWVKCLKYVQEHGHVGPSGRACAESVTLHKLADRHLKLIPELGLSPSARTRLSVATSKETKEESASLASIIAGLKQ